MSELRVDSVKSKGGGAPDLPKGVTISGITTAVTLGATQIDVSNVNVSGVVTSGTLSGSLLSTGTPTLGLGVTINSSGVAISGVATAGIVTATTLYGDGSNLTGIAATLAPLFYQPDPYDTGVLFPAGIGITFNQQVKAGTGNVTLSIANAGVAGTVVENFGVGSSVTISENRITIDPTADLSPDTIYHISYPSGCFTNNEGTDYVGTAYTFHARQYDYQLWAFGRNLEGQLGNNNRTNYSSPIQIPGTTWRNTGDTYGQGYEAWGTKNDGTLWVWGVNQNGHLGQNDVVNRSSPVQIPGTTWSDMVSMGNGNIYATAAVKTDGTLWTWGTNFRGTLGQNQAPASLSHVSSPVQVPGTTWNTAADTMGAGVNRIQAIKTDGTLWYWGYGGYGSMGNNITSTAYYSSPTQLPGTSTWSNIAVGAYFTMLTRTDNTLWGMGYGGYGNLGPANTSSNNQVSSPMQIPGTTWATGEGKLCAAANAVAAIKTDGTLWTWGINYSGQLGHNNVNPVNYSSPVQLPGTNWDQVAMENYNTIARKTDGTLWAWGYNGYGQIGEGAGGVNQSSPIQIPGTDWTKIGSNQYSNYAAKKV